METIIVLGSDCPSCKKTYELIASKVKELGIDATVEKNENINELLKYGVMSTPAVIIDDKIVHVGGIPSDKIITSWFNAPTTCGCKSCDC